MALVDNFAGFPRKAEAMVLANLRFFSEVGCKMKALADHLGCSSFCYQGNRDKFSSLFV